MSEFWRVEWYSEALLAQNPDWDETLEGPAAFRDTRICKSERAARTFAASIAKDVVVGEDPPTIERVERNFQGFWVPFGEG